MNERLPKPSAGPLVPWGLIALLVVGAGLIAMFHGTASLQGTGGTSPIPWRTDYESARMAAVTAGKPLFVDVSATWCGPCQDMAQTTWKDPEVAKALDGYVSVAVDSDAQSAIADKFGVSAVPTLIVVDPNTGKIVKRAEGEMDSQSFTEWLTGKP